MSQDGEWPQVSGQQLMPTENKPGQKKEEGYDVTPRTVVAVPGSQAAVVKGLFVFSRHMAGAILSRHLTLAPNSLPWTNLSSRLLFPSPLREFKPRNGLAHFFYHIPNPELILLLALRGLEL